MIVNIQLEYHILTSDYKTFNNVENIRLEVLNNFAISIEKNWTDIFTSQKSISSNIQVLIWKWCFAHKYYPSSVDNVLLITKNKKMTITSETFLWRKKKKRIKHSWFYQIRKYCNMLQDFFIT